MGNMVKEFLDKFFRYYLKSQFLHPHPLINMDFQWFAAEDEGRTEEPSDYKIRKAREEEGRVAKSQEFIGAMVLLLPALLLLLLAPYLLQTYTELVKFFISRAVSMDPTKDRAIVGVCLSYFLKLCSPIIVTAMVAAIVSNIVQVGFLFTTKPLAPNLSKIIPRFGKYFQKTLFSTEGLFNFLKSIVKMFVIGLTAYLLIRSKWEILTNLQTASLWQGISVISMLAVQLFIFAALLLGALAVPDYMFQRWQYRESLKMSRKEVEEERKREEGDPMVRARLRRRMRQILTKNMAVNTAKADVIITNPTHFAIALEYHKGEGTAPIVTAKGGDEMAFQIRRIALDNDVPIVENKPLARALYAETEVGDEVPFAYWQAVVLILKKVWAINEERRRERA
ncbi:MAG: flagellar biosynthesis protein FlhB [Treponema sp.]|jgi:flagellar biosynthetic protein FlhB|nr:flagellar biosynthesis protein FlhB [Treponema sp.]